MNSINEQIDYIVGAEKSLGEIISKADVGPLLNSLVQAGPIWAALLDEDGLPLAWAGSDTGYFENKRVRLNLVVEGEPRGVLEVVSGQQATDAINALAGLARSAIQLTIDNNLKRMLTTEMHATVVKESYEQLAEKHRHLLESEKRYRELSLSLDQKVQERTAKLNETFVMMLQQEKQAAVGRLAAGIAHEINNPNSFILSNLHSFEKYMMKISEMFALFRMPPPHNNTLVDTITPSDKRWHDLKMDFVLTDSMELLKQSIEGSERIARLVADMKQFSHMDEKGLVDVDLKEELERTLRLIETQAPPDTVVECRLQPMPRYTCNPGLISQAFMNIVTNALQSRNAGLKIFIEGCYSGGMIKISFQDNGCGMEKDVINLAFEPFFTTRDVGQGTGMGLTVAQKIIKEAGGKIELASVVGEGTTVTIILPLLTT